MMKGIHLIVIATVFLTSWNVITAEDVNEAVATNVQFIAEQEHNAATRAVYAEIKCPDTNPGNTTILLPHEYDCTKFYICLGREKIERLCPKMNKKGDLLHFNPRHKVCDWPVLAGCDNKNSHRDQDEIITKQHILNEENESCEDKKCRVPIPTKCPAVDRNDTTIHLAHEYDCTKFYMCLRGSKIEMKCPYMDNNGNRLHFNRCLQVCDWPSQACCNWNSHKDQVEVITKQHILNEEDGSWEDEPKECPVPIPTKCPAVDPNDTTIHLAHEYDCTKFYKCHAGRKFEMLCPYMNEEGDRLHFNKCLQVCDWPWAAGCEPCPCDSNVQEPHENCKKYYECVNCKKVLKECDDDLYFSNERQDCVKYEDSDCCNNKKPTCTREGELIPFECNCTKYYLCRKDDMVLRHCDPGLEFSPKKRKCMKPKDACCSVPCCCPPPNDCSNWSNPDQPRRHECDCRLFYKCICGRKELSQCPWGYYYNEKSNSCLPWDKEKCSNSWDKEEECSNSCDKVSP